MLLPALGCVRASYDQVSFNEPIASAQVQALQPGRDDLGSCLEVLGAPVDVFEYRVADDGTSGMALVWFWQHEVGWGLRVSAPVARNASASFDWDWAGTDTPGVVLWFGPDLVLERREQGRVGELIPSRRRPSPRTGS